MPSHYTAQDQQGYEADYRRLDEQHKQLLREHNALKAQVDRLLNQPPEKQAPVSPLPVRSPLNPTGTGGVARFPDGVLKGVGGSAVTADPHADYEAWLGNPGADGYALYSLADGTRSWAPPVVGTGGGTVTSFSAGDLSPLFTASVATAASTPALSFTLAVQTANKVFKGPSSGSPAAPGFDYLVADDLPNTAVSPGGYTNADITVDAQGRIVAASDGSGSGGITPSVTADSPGSGTYTVPDPTDWDLCYLAVIGGGATIAFDSSRPTSYTDHTGKYYLIRTLVSGGTDISGVESPSGGSTNATLTLNQQYDAALLVIGQLGQIELVAYLRGRESTDASFATVGVTSDITRPDGSIEHFVDGRLSSVTP